MHAMVGRHSVSRSSALHFNKEQARLCVLRGRAIGANWIEASVLACGVKGDNPLDVEGGA